MNRQRTPVGRPPAVATAATGGRVLPRSVGAGALALGAAAQAWWFGGRGAPRALVAVGLVVAAEAVVRAGRGRTRAAVVLRPALLAGLGFAATGTLGRVPAGMIVATVVLADAAVVSWQPASSWPSRRRPVASVAVGLLVAAQVVWFRTGSRPGTAALLALAALAIEAYARRPAAMEAIEHLVGQRLPQAISTVVWGALFAVSLVVLSPVRLAGAVRARLRSKASATPSNWQAIAAEAVAGHQDRPYLGVASPVRRRRTAFGVGVLVLGLVATSLAWRHTHPSQPDTVPAFSEVRTGGTTTPATSRPPGVHQILATEFSTKYTDLPAYAGVPWADALQREQRTPIIDGEATGRYRNVRDGHRVTIAPSCRCPKVSLWFSGGSAAFGVGQRDQHTIASELVRIAERRDGIALDIENVSHDGYTFQMEHEWEISSSLHTEKPPDLLVFYNGWNDAGAELIADFLHGLDPKRKLSVMLPPDLAQVNQRSDEFMASDIGPAAGRAAAARYLKIQAEVDREARRAGVKTAYFFQADALASLHQIESYEPLTGYTGRQLLASPIADCLAAMTKALGSKVVNLRHLFDHSDEQVFLGLVHQNEDGAKVVAEAIYEHLRPKIRALAR